MKFDELSPSNKSGKRWMIKFKSRDGKYRKVVHFGSKDYENYTMHLNDKRKESYLKRHSHNEDWKDPFSPGSLSRWILWNKPTISESLLDYRKRFNL